MVAPRVPSWKPLIAWLRNGEAIKASEELEMRPRLARQIPDSTNDRQSDNGVKGALRAAYTDLVESMAAQSSFCLHLIKKALLGNGLTFALSRGAYDGGGADGSSARFWALHS